MKVIFFSMLQVSIYLPSLKLLKSITDRMKTMTSHVVSHTIPLPQAYGPLYYMSTSMTPWDWPGRDIILNKEKPWCNIVLMCFYPTK